jgi:hypothetical protein
MALAEGMTVSKTLLDGKTFQKIHDHVRKTEPWLLVMGRIGLHGDPNDTALGSNSENLLRLCECDILLTTTEVRPKLDVRAEQSIRWSEQAEERMKRVPKLVAGIARTAILRLALEQGHSVITSSLLDEAMARFMPKQEPMDKLAEAVAIGRAQEQPVAVCKGCGLTAREPDPVVCSVCGGSTFDVLTAEMVETLVRNEGGLFDEPSYDGRKLSWTGEARSALRAIDSSYLRRRTKARIEKAVRLRRLQTVTLDFAQRLIEEETGMPLAGAPKPVARSSDDVSPPVGVVESSTQRLISRDANKVPLFSAFDWSLEAIERILTVPAGFMRDRTQARIEALTESSDGQRIDLACVEAGISLGLETMAEWVAQNDGTESASQSDPTQDEHTAQAARCPAVARSGEQLRRDGHEQPLNEVSQLTELAAMRMLLTEETESREE